MSSQLPTIGQISRTAKPPFFAVTHRSLITRCFCFERGKSCRYSTYTYSKQLGEFLESGRGGGRGWPTPPPPLNPPVAVYALTATMWWRALCYFMKNRRNENQCVHFIRIEYSMQLDHYNSWNDRKKLCCQCAEIFIRFYEIHSLTTVLLTVSIDRLVMPVSHFLR